ncbi:MAG: GNAT family N-acetyltransferase [Candidatus Bathyarchaeota archaeon]
MDNLDNLVRLMNNKIKSASETFARAFQEYSLFTYAIPDESKRENPLRYVFESMVRYGILYGEVYATSPNLEGVAVWLPSDKAETTQKMIQRISSFWLSDYSRLGKEVFSKMMAYAEYSSLIHERYTPFRHWYLWLLGVDPKFQGKGYASRLLKAMFARIDHEQLPCYLETEVEENISFYQHYDFKVLEETQLPRTEVPIIAMLRKKSG